MEQGSRGAWILQNASNSRISSRNLRIISSGNSQGLCAVSLRGGESAIAAFGLEYGCMKATSDGVAVGVAFHKMGLQH